MIELLKNEDNLKEKNEWLDNIKSKILKTSYRGLPFVFNRDMDQFDLYYLEGELDITLTEVLNNTTLNRERNINLIKEFMKTEMPYMILTDISYYNGNDNELYEYSFYLAYEVKENSELINKVLRIIDLLNDSFNWKETEPGYDYWNYVVKNLNNIVKVSD